MATVRTIEPTATPVSLADFKDHVRVAWNSEDTYLTALLAAATRLIERTTGRQFCPATYQLTVDRFPKWEFYLPVAPVTAISSISYVDTSGNPQTFTDYTADLVSEPARLTPTLGKIWPPTYLQINSVVVTFTAGYSTVPDTLKHAVKLLAGHWYEHREPISAVAGVTPTEIPFTLQCILAADGWGGYLSNIQDFNLPPLTSWRMAY